MTDVREVLDSAASGLEPGEAPLAAVLAAGRRRVRRRRLTVAGAGVATAAAVLAGVPVLSAGGGTGQPALTGRNTPGDTVCGDARFDRSELPGRRVTADEDWPTPQAADLLALHGWPRAVPYDAARWTVVTHGDSGVLVATLPGQGARYLSISRGADGAWKVGRPCTF